jgi:fatty-acyl-CoA synthase
LLYRGSTRLIGYYRDPEVTAERIDSGGWFHTGDVYRIDPSGRITFIERLKDMLKVGGENVAAAEIEDFVARHPAVKIVQIVAAPDARYVEVPCAFVELKEGAAATELELIDFCRGKIATFKVPRYVRFVDEWPMSGTKIRKVELRDNIAAELVESGIMEAPRITSG